MSTAPIDTEVEGGGLATSGDLLLERDHELAAIDRFVAGIDGGGRVCC